MAMEITKKYIPVALVLLFMFSVSLPLISFAQKDCLPDSGKICNPIEQTTIQGFLEVLVTGVIRIGLPVITLAIIYCGFLFVKARGNPEELTKAKDALLYTMIGAAVLLGAWALTAIIEQTVLAL